MHNTSTDKLDVMINYLNFSNNMKKLVCLSCLFNSLLVRPNQEFQRFVKDFDELVQ